MSKLKKKMFRDIKLNKSQFIAIFLMVFLGVLVYGGVRSYMDGMINTAEVFYRENNLEDLNVVGNNFSKDDLEKIKNMENVNDAERKLTITGTMEYKEDRFLQLNFIEENKISKFYVMDGEGFDVNKSGVWLDNFYAQNNDLKVGDTIKIKYETSNKIRVLAIDLDFILSFLSSGSFQYNGVSFPFIREDADLTNFSIEDETNRLKYINKIVQMLDMFGCKKDIDIKCLTDRDWRNIHYLVTALVDKKPVSGLKEDLPSILSVPVGALKFMVFLQKVDGQKGTYRIFDFFKTDLELVYENLKGDKVQISRYALLHADDLANVDNVRFDALLPSFQKADHHDETFARANFFLLDLLTAYDEVGKSEIINAAQDFSDWIMTATEEELPYNIRLINKLQVIKRIRPLDIDEVKELFHIIETPNVQEDILVGVYLLLDQQSAAEIHFNRLDQSMQKEFPKYPIYHFWKKQESRDKR